MTISVTDGTSATTTSAASSASFSNTTSIPNGAAIFATCSSFDGSGTVTGGGTFADGVNTYATAASVLFDNSSSEGILALFAALSSAGLASSGKTFTWTPTGSSYTGYYAVSTFYATGVGSQDTAVTATTYGSANPISWSFSGSATPSVSGSLIICATGTQAYNATGGMGGSITSPSGGATPPDFLNTGAVYNGYPVLIGTNVVQSSAAAVTYAGSFNSSGTRPWAALIAAFKPAAATATVVDLDAFFSLAPRLRQPSETWSAPLVAPQVNIAVDQPFPAVAKLRQLATWDQSVPGQIISLAPLTPFIADRSFDVAKRKTVADPWPSPIGASPAAPALDAFFEPRKKLKPATESVGFPVAAAVVAAQTNYAPDQQFSSPAKLKQAVEGFGLPIAVSTAVTQTNYAPDQQFAAPPKLRPTAPPDQPATVQRVAPPAWAPEPFAQPAKLRSAAKFDQPAQSAMPASSAAAVFIGALFETLARRISPGAMFESWQVPIAPSPIVKAITDYILRARRRGRR